MILAFLGPNELSVIERCPYYRGVRKERLDCTKSISSALGITDQFRTTQFILGFKG